MSNHGWRVAWCDQPPPMLAGNALSHFQTPAYDHLLRRYGQRPRWLAVSDADGRPQATWLLFTTPGDYLNPPRTWLGRRLDVHFQCVHGPRFAAHLDAEGRAAARQTLLAALMAEIRRLHPVTGDFSLDPVLSEEELAQWRRDAGRAGFSVASAYSYIIDLPADVEALGRCVKADRRTKVRKAERVGGVVECGADIDAMRAYYQVRLDTTQRNRLPGIAWSHFADTLDVMGPTGEIKVFLALFGERVGAAQIAFVHGRYAHLAGVCIAHWALEERVPANDLLQWGVLRWATENRMRWVDFVGAAPDSIDPKRRSIDAFKARWGTRLRPSLRLSGPHSRLRGLASGVARRLGI